MIARTALGWKRGLLSLAVLATGGLSLSSGAVFAESTAFMQSIARSASGDAVLAEFYRATGYDSVWTGRDDRARRRAFLQALKTADAHGLPANPYNADRVKDLLAKARTQRQRGEVEVQLSRLYLDFARDLSSGIIDRPSRVDSGIVRRIAHRDPAELLSSAIRNSPQSVFHGLAPNTPEYTALMAEKQTLERLLGRGGWGDAAPGNTMLEPGSSGSRVIALRDRLIRMGYMRRSSPATYDAELQLAVQQFQLAHGLAPDGVAGPSTLAEINRSVAERLRSVIVAMERERWLVRNRGQRHVLVNLTDFTTRIIDNGQVTFQTRSVVGASPRNRQSPEFSDVMEHMVLNPTWNVPRSIAVHEYLPMLQKDPNAVRYLNLIDESGEVVSREGIDFTLFDSISFPFHLKQPPSRGNALGLVKFMFPNRHNIYLHDTPEDHLFAREVRAFSHGCIRLNDPFGFAYALLARQVSNPQAYFHERLNAGVENAIGLKAHVPVHLIYRTAFSKPGGRFNFRRDIYGRDAKIWRALRDAGVELRAVRS